ncbi:uncharacterized protein C2orf80-like [Brienomyrus brachyistius]|uniref:uncharacterized protein C2orf80-like n=1 Tax=Brienomyrus brachyistius TaxID=42636 RepID=UPI0020B3E127|nr:uncharacterized protein C2orf80-like [Brienomyrus brachyistius]XP_048833847.1 uncharacterized protein C2orf80-like [Brienomyrus brachyistius]XP_048833848.1 uncharacterized protein C2orf80-like [Brienomyrus brachyistius]XP_048833849.1 uncharacterized protein C2orf80-like [Brienomyrus brachyistius]
MEARRLKQDVQALLGDYIGQRLRENGFDPKGKTSSTLLDDLVHHDLAISVAFWWLEKHEGQDLIQSKFLGTSRPGRGQDPTHLEQEAMILSSFAGMLLRNLPVEELLSLYNCKPSTAYQQLHTKSTIVHPFTLSHHPFAMLGGYKAVDHSRKHTQRLQLRRSGCSKAGAAGEPSVAVRSLASSSPQTSISASEDMAREEDEDHEG